MHPNGAFFTPGQKFERAYFSTAIDGKYHELADAIPKIYLNRKTKFVEQGKLIFTDYVYGSYNGENERIIDAGIRAKQYYDSVEEELKKYNIEVNEYNLSELKPFVESRIQAEIRLRKSKNDSNDLLNNSF